MRHASRCTKEVKDIGTGWMLPAELQSVELAAPQLLPEQDFRQRHLPTQCAGSLKR